MIKYMLGTRKPSKKTKRQHALRAALFDSNQLIKNINKPLDFKTRFARTVKI